MTSFQSHSFGVKKTINGTEQRLKGKTNEERLHLTASLSKFLQKKKKLTTEFNIKKTNEKLIDLLRLKL